MTVYTSSGSGDFSNNATWTGGAGHPSVNGDSFTIAAGHVVDFDMDTSALANGFGASTVNGTLRAKRSAGTYYLKMNASLSIGATGTLDASDGSGGAYLGTATFTILLNGAFSITISAGGVVNLICGEPTYKYVRLSQAESSSATVLHVNTDVTGDALWTNGAIIRVDNINSGANSEERTISGIPTATTITITSGLTGAKLQGSYVILISRNVKVMGAGTGSGTAFSAPAAGSVIGAEIRLIGTGAAPTAGSSVTINGTISNCGTGISNPSGAATLNCPISGCTTGINSGTNYTISVLVSGCGAGLNGSAAPIVTGVVAGCTSGITGGGGAIVFGSVFGCDSGVVFSNGVHLNNAQMSGNTQDLNNASFVARNSLLGSSIEVLNYNSALRSITAYSESLDHDQVAGAFRAWTKGGITSSVSSPVFDASRTRSYMSVCESASAYAFMQRQVLVPAGGSVYVRCYVQKDTSMAYLPRVQIFSADKEPLLSGSADAEVIMTNSVDTWEVLEATVTNTTDAPKVYRVRALAKNASGNVYFDPLVRTSALLIPADMEGLLAA